MKKILLITTAVIGLFALAVACTTTAAQTLANKGPEALRVGTYNVHYIILGKQTGAWSVGDWERRKGPLDAAFKTLDVDVIGFQEMESFARGSNGVNLTLDWLLDQNPEFAAAAVGDPKVFPSTQPILYRTDRLRKLDQGWFFFADTPDVIYARTFNGSFPAFASTAKFQDKQTGAEFHVVNVHFEYKSRSNRQLSAALVVERIQPLIEAGENVILIGDLNARTGAKTQNILTGAGLGFLPVDGSTYHLNRGLNLFGSIDHIGLTNGLSAMGETFVLREKFDGEWPTDHYPVIADIVVN